MDQAMKFYLIDASQLKQGDLLSKPADATFKERNKPIINKELERIDQTMLSIVNDNTMTNDQKIASYNTALDQYQVLNSKVNNFKPSTLAVNNKMVNDKSDNNTQNEIYNPLIGISSTYRSKASKLWTVLNGVNDLKLAKNGEVIVKDEKLLGSNITDLINASVNPRANTANIPGWTKFPYLLRSSNIPKTLITQQALDIKQSNKRKQTKSKDLLLNWAAYDSTHEKKQSKKLKTVTKKT